MVDETRTNTPNTPETLNIVNVALNVPLMFMAIIGNALVLVATLRTPSLRSASIILLCNLTLSDLLVGFLAQPLYIAREITRERSLRQIMETVAFSVCGASLSSITVISVDRLMALHFHMRYSYVMTLNRAICASAALWLICVVLSLSTLWQMNIFHFTIVASIIVCLLICTICYMKIYRIVRRHQLQIAIQTKQVAKETSKTLKDMNWTSWDRLKVPKTLLFITWWWYYVTRHSLFLCLSPLFFRQYWRDEFSLAETVAFMNSSINPFLYCWRLRELRKAVVKTTKQMLRLQTE